MTMLSIRQIPSARSQILAAVTKICKRFPDRIPPRDRDLERVYDQVTEDGYRVQLRMGHHTITLVVEYWTPSQRVLDADIQGKVYTGEGPHPDTLYRIYDHLTVRLLAPAIEGPPGEVTALLAFYSEVAVFALQLEVEFKDLTVVKHGP